MQNGTPEQNLLELSLADKESVIKKALLGGNMATAKQRVNGGANGRDRFEEIDLRGMTLMPDSPGT
jgi:peptidoglycan L-alanyl-D-glutamate endopeptidase CwlK